MIASTLVLFCCAVSGVAVATFFVTRFQRAGGVICIMAAQLFGPSYAVPHTSLNFAKAAILAALAAILSDEWVGPADIFQRGRASIRQPGNDAARSVLTALLLLIAATALTFVTARFHGPVLRETAKAGEYFCAALIGIYSVRDQRDRRFILRGLGVITGIVVLCALAQEWTGAPSVFRAGSRLVARIAGPLEGPNQLAGFLGIMLPLLSVGVIIDGRDRQSGMPHARVWFGCISMFLATVADVLTYSRGGLFALLISVGIIAAWPIPPETSEGNATTRPPLAKAKVDHETLRRRRPFSLAGLALRDKGPALASLGIGLAAGFISAAIVAGSGIWHFGSVSDAGDTGAVGHRSQLWHAAWIFFQRSPWLGIGAGNFERELGDVGYYHVHTHANSLYFQALAEGGIVLFSATVITIVVPLFWLFRRACASSTGITVADDTFARTMFALGMLSAAVGLALHHTVDTLAFYPKVGLLYWLLIGCALAEKRQPA